jgi:hypothetical protein
MALMRAVMRVARTQKWGQAAEPVPSTTVDINDQSRVYNCVIGRILWDGPS